ncbi:MAG: DHH family phosphoesterase [Clostridia bacterium]|nr:DHH family phosphoesterase [Clostridia bacterium]
MEKFKKSKWFDFSIFSVRITYLSIITILSLVILVISPSLFYGSLVLIFIATMLSILVCISEIKNRKYRIQELSQSVDIVLKDSLNLIDIPMVMLTSPTEIIWQNTVSKHIFPKEFIVDTALMIDKNLKQSETATVTSDIGNGEVYCAIGNYIKFSSFNCMLISYINKTEENRLKNTLENTKIAVGIVFIDNYEETMQGLDELEKSEITSKILKVIREWVSENNGIVTKIDKDRFVIFVEKQYVDQMEKNTFEILQKVREITDVTKLPVTISIGLSYNESNLDERYAASSSALDIALGRGGDQVVVKKDKKFDFYGGVNLGLEKTNRVRARTISQALREIMLKSDKIYVMGHKNSDIDCIGASVGMYKMAKLLGKQANIIIDTKSNSSTKAIIDKIKTAKEYEDVFITVNDTKKLDFTNSLLIVVDTHKKSYLAYPDLLDEFEKVVIVDHHRRGPEFIDNALLTYHEIYASSTSELVTEILMYLDDISLTPIEAESLYAGIVIDTKNFIFKTGVRTFEVAAYLKKFGIDLTEVKQIFQNDFETYIAKVEIVKNAEIINGQIAISVCSEEYEDMPIIAAQAADELLSISGILASFVLCKVDEVVMISGRSMGDINVQTILEKVGGGGHLTFAGAQIAGVSLEEAKETLVSSINEYYIKE